MRGTLPPSYRRRKKSKRCRVTGLGFDEHRKVLTGPHTDFSTRSWAVLARSSARRCASGSSRRTPRAAAAILGDLDRAPRAPPLGVAAERDLGLPSQVGGVVRGAAPILPGAAERAEQHPLGLPGRTRVVGAVAGHGTPLSRPQS